MSKTMINSLSHFRRKIHLPLHSSLLLSFSPSPYFPCTILIIEPSQLQEFVSSARYSSTPYRSLCESAGLTTTWASISASKLTLFSGLIQHLSTLRLIIFAVGLSILKMTFWWSACLGCWSSLVLIWFFGSIFKTRRWVGKIGGYFGWKYSYFWWSNEHQHKTGTLLNIYAKINFLQWFSNQLDL